MSVCHAVSLISNVREGKLDEIRIDTSEFKLSLNHEVAINSFSFEFFEQGGFNKIIQIQSNLVNQTEWNKSEIERATNLVSFEINDKKKIQSIHFSPVFFKVTNVEKYLKLKLYSPLDNFYPNIKIKVVCDILFRCRC